MKTNRICLLALAALSSAAWGQKVETHETNGQQVVHLKTALNHLTVIETNEPVMSVAVGSPTFKVEWRENKVFVEPTDANVATNLFVWTAAGRSNYELDPAGEVTQMDFAIDEPVPNPPSPSKASAASEGPSPGDLLLAATSVRFYGSAQPKGSVIVYVTQVLEWGNEVFIRYTLQNHTRSVYSMQNPRVVLLSSPQYRVSLTALANAQLSSEVASHLKTGGEVFLETFDEEISATRIASGQQASGVIGIRLGLPTPHASVLRLSFPASSKGQVTATVVL